MKSSTYLTIGETARRCGLKTSTLRFYEERGLISSERTTGNQRRYRRATLRRISVVKVAQTIGLTLEEIGEALAELPDGRTPTKRDWESLSRKWRSQLDSRIDQLQRMPVDWRRLGQAHPLHARAPLLQKNVRAGGR